jgi:hypothetical protein
MDINMLNGYRTEWIYIYVDTGIGYIYSIKWMYPAY